jgi:hypothetical protein
MNKNFEWRKIMEYSVFVNKFSKELGDLPNTLDSRDQIRKVVKENIIKQWDIAKKDGVRYFLAAIEIRGPGIVTYTSTEKIVKVDFSYPKGIEPAELISRYLTQNLIQIVDCYIKIVKLGKEIKSLEKEAYELTK